MTGKPNLAMLSIKSRGFFHEPKDGRASAQAGHFHWMGVRPDVLGLFSRSVGLSSAQVGLRRVLCSVTVGTKIRCSRTGGFICPGCYS